MKWTDRYVHGLEELLDAWENDYTRLGQRYRELYNVNKILRESIRRERKERSWDGFFCGVLACIALAGAGLSIVLLLCGGVVCFPTG